MVPAPPLAPRQGGRRPGAGCGGGLRRAATTRCTGRRARVPAPWAGPALTRREVKKRGAVLHRRDGHGRAATTQRSNRRPREAMEACLCFLAAAAALCPLPNPISAAQTPASQLFFAASRRSSKQQQPGLACAHDRLARSLKRAHACTASLPPSLPPTLAHHSLARSLAPSLSARAFTHARCHAPPRALTVRLFEHLPCIC